MADAINDLFGLSPDNDAAIIEDHGTVVQVSVETKCGICQAAIETDGIVVLKCTHMFCRENMTNMFGSRNRLKRLINSKYELDPKTYYECVIDLRSKYSDGPSTYTNDQLNNFVEQIQSLESHVLVAKDRSVLWMVDEGLSFARTLFHCCVICNAPITPLQCNSEHIDMPMGYDGNTPIHNIDDMKAKERNLYDNLLNTRNKTYWNPEVSEQRQAEEDPDYSPTNSSAASEWSHILDGYNQGWCTRRRTH